LICDVILEIWEYSSELEMAWKVSKIPVQYKNNLLENSKNSSFIEFEILNAVISH
jgi:hypothetical protein